MTPQQILQKSYDALKAQGYRCVYGGKCVYSDFNGGGCAVGVLLEEDLAQNWTLKGYGAVHSILETVPDLPEWFIQHQDLLFQMQDAHDKAKDNFVPTIATEYNKIAKDYGVELKL